MPSYSWFPIHEKMLLNGDFQRLTTAEKLFYFTLICDYNLNYADLDSSVLVPSDVFYKADIEYAVLLNLSVDKIRRARRKFAKLGWVEFTAGHKKGGRSFATTYHHVKWALTPDRDSYELYGWVDRHTYRSFLLKHTRKAHSKFVVSLHHADMVIYVYLWYFHRKYGEKTTTGTTYFYVQKKELRKLSGIQDIRPSFDRLKEVDKTGLYPFEYLERKIRFDDWQFFSHPDENKPNREIYERAKDSFKNDLEKARKKEVTQKKKKEQRDREKAKELIANAPFMQGKTQKSKVSP